MAYMYEQSQLEDPLSIHCEMNQSRIYEYALNQGRL